MGGASVPLRCSRTSTVHALKALFVAGRQGGDAGRLELYRAGGEGEAQEPLADGWQLHACGLGANGEDGHLFALQVSRPTESPLAPSPPLRQQVGRPTQVPPARMPACPRSAQHTRTHGSARTAAPCLLPPLLPTAASAPATLQCST